MAYNGCPCGTPVATACTVLVANLVGDGDTSSCTGSHGQGSKAQFACRTNTHYISFGACTVHCGVLPTVAGAMYAHHKAMRSVPVSHASTTWVRHNCYLSWLPVCKNSRSKLSYCECRTIPGGLIRHCAELGDTHGIVRQQAKLGDTMIQSAEAE